MMTTKIMLVKIEATPISAKGEVSSMIKPQLFYVPVTAIASFGSYNGKEFTDIRLMDGCEKALSTKNVVLKAKVKEEYLKFLDE